MKSPFFHLKFWHILHLLMYLGKYPVWFFKVKLKWCIATFCNLWVVGLKLSRYVVIYISFFWKAELCTYSTFNIFQPPSLIILPAILLNLQVILYGDQIPWNKQENVIVICNHQSSGTNLFKETTLHINPRIRSYTLFSLYLFTKSFHVVVMFLTKVPNLQISKLQFLRLECSWWPNAIWLKVIQSLG